MEPVSLPQVRVLPSGMLEGDRQFAFFDSDGNFINAKHSGKIHLLRSKYDASTNQLSLGRAETGLMATFHIVRQLREIQLWLTEYFDQQTFFRQSDATGFPDRMDSLGPTVVSTATLTEVASWFDSIDAAQMRLRIRANIEIGGVPPFWEDKLVGPKDSLIHFRIGDCLFDGNKPCQRCNVPPRDPLTGESIPGFAKVFSQKRMKYLPPWAEKSRFDHYYRLAVSTKVPQNQTNKSVRVGDEVVLM
jgi:uncharacterized protein YcbX